MKRTGTKFLSLALVLCMVLTMFPIMGIYAFATKRSGDYEYTIGQNGEAYLCSYRGNDVDIKFPSKLDGYTVTAVAQSFRLPETIKSVEVPATMTNLDLKTIGGGIFHWCPALTDVKVDPANPKYADINGVLFSKDKKDIVCYPAGRTATSYSIPDGVKVIDYCAFAGCDKIKKIIIPDSVTTINSRAFVDCTALTDINIPSAFKSPAPNRNGSYGLGDLVFENCKSLKNISLPIGVTDIPSSMFRGCSSLTSFVVPDNCEEIFGNAFEGCTNLKSIIIPAKTKLVYSGIFSGCNSLTIYGYAGSPAENYAKENNIPFALTSELITTNPSVSMGKPSSNGNVTANKSSGKGNDAVTGNTAVPETSEEISGETVSSLSETATATTTVDITENKNDNAENNIVKKGNTALYVVTAIVAVAAVGAVATVIIVKSRKKKANK